MRNKLALIAGAAIVATLTIVATPGVSAADETVNWSAQATVPDAGTSATPSMTTCNGVTYMVWKGVGNDDRMWYSSLTPEGTWAPQQVVGGGGGTSTGPTVACDWFNSIMVVWKGVGNDEQMYYTTAQVEASQDQPLGPLQWDNQKVVDGGGRTDLSPSLVVMRTGDGVPYLAWRGAGGDTSVHYATLPGAGGPWQVLGTVPGMSTVRAPTLTSGLSASTLSLVWPQPGSQQIVYSNYLGGTSWSTPNPIVGGSAAAPATTEGPDDGYNPRTSLVAWQGAGNDTHLWYTINQGRWQAQQVVTNGGPTMTGLAAADDVTCVTSGSTCITTVTAYLAWMGPQGQIQFVHGLY